MRRLYKKNLQDLIYGATLLGTGGGGSPKPVWGPIDEIFKKRTL